MTNSRFDLVRPLLLGACLVLAALPARATAASLPGDPPEAPAFSGWVVKKDTVVAPKQIAGIEQKLGAKIKALRNTTYEVSGKAIQVNVIAAADASEADKLYHSLTKGKAEWAVARKGTVLYEFVGKNDVMDEIKAAQAKLAAP